MDADPQVPGVLFTETIVIEKIKDDLRDLVNLERAKEWNKHQFPGSHPVSMTRANMHLIEENDYLVCEKSDGVRYLLLLCFDRAYLIDRKYNFYMIDKFTIPFPTESNKEQLHNYTLLDCELVQTSRQSTTYEIGTLVILVFDILALSALPCMNLSLTQRLQLIQSYVLLPFSRKLKEGGYNDGSLQFMLQLKQMYPSKLSRYIWFNIVPKLPHHCDGLIYTPINRPYEPGTCYNLLKWKPYDLNSVDFELRIEYFQKKPYFELHCQDKGITTFFDWISFDNSSEYENKGGQILECVFDRNVYTYVLDPENVESAAPDPHYNDLVKGLGWRRGGWKILRLRGDKGAANDKRIVDKLMESIRDNVTIEDMCKLVENKK